MKSIAAIVLAIALSGCASQAVSPVSGGYAPLVERERPAILFVNSPGMKALPQQVIGDERPGIVLDGLG